MAVEKNKKTQKAESIKELQAENKRLSGEVEILKREIEKIRGKKTVFGDKSDASLIAFERQAVNEDLFKKDYYSSYFIKSISKTTGYTIYERIIKALKRYNFVKISFQVLTFVFAMIQSGTIFLLTTSAMIIFAPFAFLLSGLAFIATHILSGVDNRRNKKILAGKNITLFFPPKGAALSTSSYFAGFVAESAILPDSCAVVISPYFFRTRGISGKRRYYFFSRVESENILIVRRHYFFKLRKKIILPYSKDINMIF